MKDRSIVSTTVKQTIYVCVCVCVRARARTVQVSIQ